MSDSLGASPLASFAPTSLTLSSPRTGAGMTMKMTMGLTKGQMSDSLGAAPSLSSLLRRSLLLRRGPVLAWKRRKCTALAKILKSNAHTATRKPRRRGCCGSASSAALHGAHIIVHTLTTTQSSHSWWKGRHSMASHVERPPAYHDGHRSAYSSTNSWASNRSNLHERSVQLTLHERLRAFDLRVSHSPCLR